MQFSNTPTEVDDTEVDDQAIGDEEVEHWTHKIDHYGDDHPGLCKYIQSFAAKPHANDDIFVEIIEVSSESQNRRAVRTFRELKELKVYLCETVTAQDRVRAVTIRKLSAGLIKLLGAKYDMDYEMWTCRYQSSDREYFAAPLNERGARRFSHFHLACVEFFRSSPALTPDNYLKSQRITHSARLMGLIDSKRPNTSSQLLGQRMYLIRRISGHLRLDGNLWTFLYFCDSFPGAQESHFTADVPGDAMPPQSEWVSQSLRADTSEAFYEKVTVDGFGIVVKVLREIKSSWKLFLNELETFLEEINETFSNDDFVEATSYLHRQFILNLDNFQRQLFYHQRYITYLISAPTHTENMIWPSLFIQDLIQERDALNFVDSRLKAIRDRTTTVLDMIVGITNIKQARLAGEIAQLQREDARTSLRQGESIKKLTIINMVFLPPSFIATVYGMNTSATRDGRIWTFAVLATCFLLGTFTVLALVSIREKWKPKPESKSHG